MVWVANSILATSVNWIEKSCAKFELRAGHSRPLPLLPKLSTSRPTPCNILLILADLLLKLLPLMHLQVKILAVKALVEFVVIVKLLGLNF